jgi:hypothetical protein
MGAPIAAIIAIGTMALAAMLWFSITFFLTQRADATTTVISIVKPTTADTIDIAADHTLVIDAGGALDQAGLITNRGNLIIKGTLDMSSTGARLDNYGHVLMTSQGTFDAGDHGEPGRPGGVIANRPGGVIQVEKGASFTMAQFHNQGRVTNLGKIANQGVWYNECGGAFDDSGTYSGTSPTEYCILSTSVIVMSDTTEGTPSLVFAGRHINAEFVTPSSVLVGKKIDSITVKLARVGNPAGTFEVGVFNADLTLKKSFATANTTSLPSSLQEIEFRLPATNPLYTIEVGDRIGIRYGGGNAANGINVAIDRTTSDALFDGTASYRTRYESGWLVDTGEDMYMILKQTRQ